MQLNCLSIWSNNTSNPVSIMAAIIELSLTLKVLAGLYMLSPPDSAVSPQSCGGCTGQGKVRGCLRLQAAYSLFVPPCRCHRRCLTQGRHSLKGICGSKTVPWEASVCRWLRAGAAIAAIPYQFDVASFLKVRMKIEADAISLCFYDLLGVFSFSSWTAHTRESSPDTKAVCSQRAEQRGFYQQKLLLKSRQTTLTSPESRYPVDPLCIKKNPKQHSWKIAKM